MFLGTEWAEEGPAGFTPLPPDASLADWAPFLIVAGIAFGLIIAVLISAWSQTNHGTTTSPPPPGAG